MDNEKTQHSVLVECISIYKEVSALSELLLQNDDEQERSDIITKRGNHIEYCEIQLAECSKLKLGSTADDIAEHKECLNSIILQAITLDTILAESLSDEMSTIQSKLNNSNIRNRAVTSYGVQSLYGKI